MDKKTFSQPLYKGRSLTACMENAFQLLRNNWWGILKAAWLPLGIYAVGEAITTLSTSTQTPNLVLLSIGMLVILLGGLSFFGLFYHWLAAYKKTGEFTPLEFRKNVKSSLRQSVRFLVVHIPSGILVGILAYFAVFSLLSLFMPVPYSVLPLWVGIVAFLAILYLSIPLTVFCLDYLVGSHSYYAAFVKGLTMGTRRWGAFFALGFIVVVLYGIFSMLVALPLEISVIIEAMNRVSMADGNAYALPGFFPIVKFILTALLMFIIEAASIYPLLSLVFLYTSYESLSKEQVSYKKQQDIQEKNEDNSK